MVLKYRFSQPQRHYANVPYWVISGFVLIFSFQLLLHYLNPISEKQLADFPKPPSITAFQLVALGDDIPVAYLLLLWLQAFDHQSGTSVRYQNLNYTHLGEWLNLILRLNPQSHYPLLLAGRVYASVHDSDRKRLMLDFISQKFLESPNDRWRWMAHACLVAKHNLNDMPLALEYAQQLTQYATSPEVPFWAKDLQLILLQEMNELEAAKLLVGALLESGQIVDPYELRFLQSRLTEIEEKLR